VLEKHDFAVAHVEDVLVVLDGVARTDRNPGQIGAPQAECADPGSDVIVGPYRPLGACRVTTREQRMGDLTGEFARFGEGETALVLTASCT